MLAKHSSELSYTPCDVSLALVLTAAEAARCAIKGL